ncbi:hypothetical protein [Dawidia soli]|uniref:Right handed beta helix domain-containing protein n=1 Tax=Dawidia soli TaxID=2782352 RepID=A0AAP2DD77_9BACT|nr:hypothetical protein [Dawidia soli]MBT1689898.1 hypothetical protein [Dawidia soli]
MKSQIFLLGLLICALAAQVEAQVKIGDNPATIDPNSLLELESTNKGFLPPRVALTSLSSVAPLTGAVPTGMLVYSSGGVVADGYYYWNATQWVPFIYQGEASVTTKTATGALAKSETFVIASNDITLTLPAITGADDGLSMTIKNVGTHTDQVDVVPSGSSTIDGTTVSKHFRWVAKTYVASGGDWLIKVNEGKADNIFEVSETGSWTTIAEVIEFLDLHMVEPSVVRLVGGEYPVAATQTIDLPFPLTIQGSTYGAATITAGGASGTLFDCMTETYFKMLAFDAAGASGVDAIHLNSNNEYYEIKDCTIDGFDKGIVALSNVEMWVFELDILNATSAGIEIVSGGLSGVSLKISETDFLNCEKGINLLSGTNPVVSILNCGFYNDTAGQIGINYVPATFTSLSRVFVTNNSWNNTGTFMEGFDFTLASGRDANTFIKNNSGGQDRNPNSRINVANNSATTSITTAGTWYKANWTAGTQTSITTKWTISTNRITYQPVNRADGWAVITGNLQVPSNNRTISIAIVKNGVTTTRFGETDLRLTTAGDPYQFATTIYLTGIGPGDYFEIYCTSSVSGETVTFRDVQWFTETK